jgi:natural product biosynthesis luciferase-like monooxygenase protein
MGIHFGLIFFSSSEALFSGDKYRLVIESARYADRHGFSSIWIPERHFTKDGWLYPNPAVLQAALARETCQIHLRAGSVVVPLHNPIRIAEEWAMVDNLSNGRVGLSFASGWHPNDFVFFPENYEQRHAVMYRGIEIVRKLWRGESIQVKGGNGQLVDIKTYPTPIQPELPFWVTAAGNPKTFAGAGEIGANLLTHMFNQSIEELAEKIQIYRNARAVHGFDPQTGQVSLMLHTFVGEDAALVREQVRGPFSNYLKSGAYLVDAIAYSRGQKIDMASLSEQDLDDYLQFVFERLISSGRVLFGTPESCLDMIVQLKAAGVDEIACQLDFGIDLQLALDSLPALKRLKDSSAAKLASISSNETTSNRSSGPSISTQSSDTLTSAKPSYIPTSSVGADKPSNISTPSVGADLSRTHPIYRESAYLNKLSPDLGNSLQQIQQSCSEEVAIAPFYRGLYERGIQLGGGFQGIERLWRRDGEALGHVQLAEQLVHEADDYQVHPALLDSCFQVLIAALPSTIWQSEDVLYLPTGLRGFKLHQRPELQVWSHAMLTSSNAGATLEGDVTIMDEHGEVLIEATGLQLQRSEPVSCSTDTTEMLKDWLYELRWEPVALEMAISAPTGPATQGDTYSEGQRSVELATLRPSARSQVGKWLIFMDRDGVGRKLAELLAARGELCFGTVPGSGYSIVEPGIYQLDPANADEVQRVVLEVSVAGGMPLRGVIHLWSLDTAVPAQTNSASLLADQVLSVGNSLHVIQSLLKLGQSEPPRLWLVTRGAQPVAEQNGPDAQNAQLAVSQAPLWGLGKTCAMEQPELWGGLIDLDPQASTVVTAQQLLTALDNARTEPAGVIHEDLLAFRQGQSFAARMVRSRTWTPRKLSIHADATYLITGGLWGLGLEVARWLVAKGARHLVLLGRTALPAREQWGTVAVGSRQAHQLAGLRSLELAGAHVHYAAVDVADEGQLSNFLQTFAQQGHPPIRGVMHAASVWQDAQGQSLVRPLANLDSAALQAVFRPKVLGAWLLHTLLKDTPLDFFVSFSSGASLFGSAAQGNYAAAGEFLDVLAHRQRALGQPAISIDWGAVSETGFGATSEGLRVHEYWETRGIQRITPRQVLDALELLIPQSVARVGVLKLDWQLLREFYAQITTVPLLKYLVAETHETAATTTNTGVDAILSQLLSADQAKRLDLVVTYLRELVAGVLRVPVAKLDVEQPLTALGLDSLMAIELKNRIERELKVRIPIVTFLQGPGIVQFAGQILEQLEGQPQGLLLQQLAARQESPMPVSSQTQPMQKQETNGRQVDAEQLLTQLDQLSDTEVDALLQQMLEEDGEQNGTLQELHTQDPEQLLAHLDQLSDDSIDSLLSQMVQKED